MSIEFILNAQHIILEEDVPPGRLTLDWLRDRQRLTGTKEGCKEGDCGACSVMVGDYIGGKLTYQPVTSCLMPVGELHGKHLITIEGLNLPDQALNPVQEAMVERGGSQCGYCTPGFIVSMCWYLMQGKGEAPTEKGFEQATSGNLCRCTGYGSIWRASADLAKAFGQEGEFYEIWTSDDRVKSLIEHGLLPGYLSDIAARLQAIPALPASTQSSPDFVIAGGTDLYVQRGEEIPVAQNIEVLNRRPDMSYITVSAGTVSVGGLTTFETFGQDAHIQSMIPSIMEDMELIASLPIRNRASIAGNLINASPIGDMTAMMLALGTDVVLQDLPGKETRRTLPLDELYLGYKTLAKKPNELVTELQFDVIKEDEVVSFEKVSKRRYLDIATVNSAARLRVDKDGKVLSARLALGGVAAIPLFLKKTSAWLVGKTINPATLHGMIKHANEEISPISDVRGSARYKSLLARQLLLAHFDKCFPEFTDLSVVLGPQFAVEVTP